MTENRHKIHRLDRVLQVRQIAVDSAEARVAEALKYIAHLKGRLAVEEGRILRALEEFAHPDGTTAVQLHQAEATEKAAQFQARKVRKDIERANSMLVEREIAWRLARQEKKTVEKLRERKLQKAVSEEGALMQKFIDEASIAKYLQTTRA